MAAVEEMPAGVLAATKPLATFCILAFNQEQFVETAMLAAFAQTYEPLEIIVSDDGSSDATFECARLVAARYTGQHRLIVRRSDRNRGILHHLFDVADLASGRLLIVSAADDVSLPHRTAAMVSAWQATGYAGAFADYAVIDTQGAIVEDHYRFDHSMPLSDYFDGVSFSGLHGASSTYDLDHLRTVARPHADETVVFEDTWLSLVSTALGRTLAHVPEVLVQYRRHAGAITNFTASGNANRESLILADAQWRKRARAFAGTLASFRSWLSHSTLVRPVNRRLLDDDIAYFEHVGGWDTLSPSQRIQAFRYASRGWMRNAVVLRILPIQARRLISFFRRFASSITNVFS